MSAYGQRGCNGHVVNGPLQYVLKAAAAVIGLSVWPGTGCTVAMGDAKGISCSR